MGLGILKYKLPEEKDDFKIAQKGIDFFSLLWDLDQDLRSKLKHGHTFKTPDEVMEYVRDFIWEEINLDEYA